VANFCVQPERARSSGYPKRQLAQRIWGQAHLLRTDYQR
jgi:hypothetical protein